MIGEDVMKTVVFLMTKEENKSDDHEILSMHCMSNSENLLL